MGKKLGELEQIRKALGMTQEDFAPLLGAAAHSTYHRWETSPNTPSSRKALERAKAVYKQKKKAEWTGPEAAAPAGGPYVTERDFAEWRGYWRGGMEGVLERLKALEDQVRTLRQQAGSK